ncbi:MAG TPA: epoxyqueuosine reductase QueH [Candidatus Paceibacterota bacterium]|nr:epoxyqueuosine reductase QueH [Candidatus Paceibacterota bacterium]HRZ29627.1 epoxyqueuosine reductase QueH [Candidatus Paceibacterota bacterium]
MSKKTFLLQTCCAPCALPILEYLKDKDFYITLYYFNPNIYDEKEFWKRFYEVCTIADIYHCSTILHDYNHKEWLDFLKKNLNSDLEKYVENGERCKGCLYMRLKYSFVYAKDNDFDMFSSTFLTNLYKDTDFVRKTIVNLTKNSNVKFLDLDIDKKEFYKKGIELCKKHNIYRQKFCGCEFSINQNEK